MNAKERATLIAPFFYLSCRSQEFLDEEEELQGFGKQLYLHRKDVTPKDIISIMDLTDVMSAAAEAIGDEHGENWITALLNGEVEPDERVIHKASLAGVNVR